MSDPVPDDALEARLRADADRAAPQAPSLDTMLDRAVATASRRPLRAPIVAAAGVVLLAAAGLAIALPAGDDNNAAPPVAGPSTHQSVHRIGDDYTFEPDDKGGRLVPNKQRLDRPIAAGQLAPIQYAQAARSNSTTLTLFPDRGLQNIACPDGKVEVVSESDDKVELALRGTGKCRGVPPTVRLSSPLAGRTIIDAKTGKATPGIDLSRVRPSYFPAPYSSKLAGGSGPNTDRSGPTAQFGVSRSWVTAGGYDELTVGQANASRLLVQPYFSPSGKKQATTSAGTVDGHPASAFEYVHDGQAVARCLQWRADDSILFRVCSAYNRMGDRTDQVPLPRGRIRADKLPLPVSELRRVAESLP